MKTIIVATFLLLVYGARVDGYSNIIKNCCDVVVGDVPHFAAYTKQSGTYNIIDFCSKGPLIQGYCDLDTDGGGWLVIQRRRYSNIDFNRPWSDYEKGFGYLYSEFWYGLKPISCFTSKGT